MLFSSHFSPAEIIQMAFPNHFILVSPNSNVTIAPRVSQSGIETGVKFRRSCESKVECLKNVVAWTDWIDTECKR